MLLDRFKHMYLIELRCDFLSDGAQKLQRIAGLLQKGRAFGFGFGLTPVVLGFSPHPLGFHAGLDRSGPVGGLQIQHPLAGSVGAYGGFICFGHAAALGVLGGQLKQQFTWNGVAGDFLGHGHGLLQPL